MTKRFYLFVVAAMLAYVSFAQPSMPGVRFGDVGKKYDYLMAHSSRIVSEQGGELIIATWDTWGFLGALAQKGLQVVAVDTNMEVLRQVSLPDTRMDELVFANYVDGRVYLLYRKVLSGQYHRAVVEPQSMTIESCEEVFSGAQGKNVSVYYWSAQSDNRLFYALADVVVNRMSREAAHRQLLLDEKMEVLWEKRFGTSELSNIRVSDEGEVYLFGSRYESGRQETSVVVHVLDVDDERSVVGQMSVGQVHHLSLLNIVNNGKTAYAVAAGYIRTPDSPKKKDCFDKMVGLSLNLNTSEMRVQTAPFSSDELNVFGNKSTKKENKVGMVDELIEGGSIGTPYGGVMLLQRCWKVTTHSTKTPDVHDYYTMGSLALAVDTTGSILWRKPFRTVNDERTGSACDLPCYRDAPLFAEGDNVYVMLPEQPKTPETYDIAASATRIMLGVRTHSNVIYGIDRQGRVEKRVPLPKEKASFMNNFVRMAPGRYIGILSSNKKSALVYVDF